MMHFEDFLSSRPGFPTNTEAFINLFLVMNHSQNSQKTARVARDELRERPICLFLLLRLSRDTKQEGAREIGFRDCLPAPALACLRTYPPPLPRSLPSSIHPVPNIPYGAADERTHLTKDLFKKWTAKLLESRREWWLLSFDPKSSITMVILFAQNNQHRPHQKKKKKTLL